jgi:hypothetical protein
VGWSCVDRIAGTRLVLEPTREFGFELVDYERQLVGCSCPFDEHSSRFFHGDCNAGTATRACPDVNASFRSNVGVSNLGANARAFVNLGADGDCHPNTNSNGDPNAGSSTYFDTVRTAAYSCESGAF